MVRFGFLCHSRDFRRPCSHPLLLERWDQGAFRIRGENFFRRPSRFGRGAGCRGIHGSWLHKLRLPELHDSRGCDLGRKAGRETPFPFFPFLRKRRFLHSPLGRSSLYPLAGEDGSRAPSPLKHREGRIRPEDFGDKGAYSGGRRLPGEPFAKIPLRASG